MIQVILTLINNFSLLISNYYSIIWRFYIIYRWFNTWHTLNKIYYTKIMAGNAAVIAELHCLNQISHLWQILWCDIMSHSHAVTGDCALSSWLWIPRVGNNSGGLCPPWSPLSPLLFEPSALPLFEPRSPLSMSWHICVESLDAIVWRMLRVFPICACVSPHW